jgi:hypothetical protein
LNKVLPFLPTAIRRFAILAPKAALRHCFAVAKPVNESPIIVVSPGGTASTALIEHLAKFVSVNERNDSDGLKHMAAPPKWLAHRPQTRVIYLDRDISEIIHSLVRRGYLYEQLAKLGCFLACLSPPAKAATAFAKAAARQKLAWRAFDSERIKFIDYTNLQGQAEAIQKFLGITDQRFVSNFPIDQASKQMQPHGQLDANIANAAAMAAKTQPAYPDLRHRPQKPTNHPIFGQSIGLPALKAPNRATEAPTH